MHVKELCIWDFIHIIFVISSTTSYILIQQVCQSVSDVITGSGSSTTSLGIQWMDGAPMGAESFWPSVI